MCTFIDIVYVVIKIYTYSMDLVYAHHNDMFCSIPKYDCYYNYRHPDEDNGHAHREKREYHSNAKNQETSLEPGSRRLDMPRPCRRRQHPTEQAEGGGGGGKNRIDVTIDCC